MDVTVTWPSREVAVLRDKGERVPIRLALGLKALDRLVFTKWRNAVGGRLRFFVSGGAALPPELAYIFAGAGITILQGYGLTETSPVVSFNRPEANRIGTIGQPIPGVKVRAAEDGELLVQGDNVMQGYYQLPEETASVLVQYADGVWFHTGDIGTIDGDGYIRITDRKKDLIKTSLGKYIAPQQIENYASLTILSTDPETPSTAVALAAVNAIGYEGLNEPTVAALTRVLGYTTNIGSENYVVSKSQLPVGDEVISPAWKRVNQA